jgi:predicted lipoprotein with Yx(FWY)xxD motif
MTDGRRWTPGTGATTARSRLRPRTTALGTLGAAALVLLSACGSGGDGGASGSSAAGAGAAGAKAAAHSGAIATRSSGLGKILVDPRGMTLYAFAADSANHSACTGSCLAYWPPVPGADAAAVAGSGVTAKLGTIKRSDGSRQLTANGFPMYTYVGDSAAGQTNGQGKNLSGGLWWVVGPTGAWVKGAGATTSGTSAGTRGGY